MSTPLVRMPPAFSKGSTVTYTRTLSDFPASQGWALNVYIRGVQALNKTATASGDSFVITLAAADTGTLTAGGYKWLERASKAGTVTDVDSDDLTVTPDLATAAAGDLQSFEEKALVIVEAALLVDVTSNIVTYQIGDRGVTRSTRKDALKFRDDLVRRINRRRNGGKLGQPIHVRFGRAVGTLWPGWPWS